MFHTVICNDRYENAFHEHTKDIHQIKTIYKFSLPCRNHHDNSNYCDDIGIKIPKESCLKSKLLLSECSNQCNNCEIIEQKCPDLGDELCTVAKKWVGNG